MVEDDRGQPRRGGAGPGPATALRLALLVLCVLAAAPHARAQSADPVRTLAQPHATDDPAAIGRHMTNTDSHEFQDHAPAISVRENERGAQVGNGWDPQWHQPSDVFTTYSDKDFRLGLNAAQTILAAVARLAGAAVN